VVPQWIDKDQQIGALLYRVHAAGHSGLLDRWYHALNEAKDIVSQNPNLWDPIPTDF